MGYGNAPEIWLNVLFSFACFTFFHLQPYFPPVQERTLLLQGHLEAHLSLPKFIKEYNTLKSRIWNQSFTLKSSKYFHLYYMLPVIVFVVYLTRE